MYQVKYSKQAIKALRKMPNAWSKRIMDKIKEVAKSPYDANQVKALKGAEGYRLRVGDWRVIYSVRNKEIP